MTSRMLPILTTLKAGQSVELVNVSGVVIEVDGWICTLSNETPGWASLKLGTGAMGQRQRLTFPDGTSLNVRIPVLSEGYLFGTPDMLNLTTKDGAAGPTVSVHRKKGDSVDLTKRYSAK